MSDKLHTATQPSSRRRADPHGKAYRDNVLAPSRQQNQQNQTQARYDIRIVRRKQVHSDTRSQKNGSATDFSEQAHRAKHDIHSRTGNSIWNSGCCTHATTDVAQVDIGKSVQTSKKCSMEARHGVQHSVRGRIQKTGKKVEARKRKDMEKCAKKFSGQLKANATPAEKHFALLLEHLGIRYDFQMPVRKKDHFFIVDFYLRDYASIVEIDGEYHCSLDQQLKDSFRTKEILQKTKYARVIRYTNQQILSYDSKALAHDLVSKLCPWAFDTASF